MEPWKLAAIAAIVVGFIGFGMFSSSSSNKFPVGNTAGGSGVVPTPGPPAAFAKYMGGTLPNWPTVTQWVNTPAPVNLATLKGKPVLVEVFRIECSHCQEAAPFL